MMGWRGGKDAGVGGSVGAGGGEIPAASAGMTGMASAGMTEVGGNDGLAGAGRMQGWGAALVLVAARYPRQARV